MSLTKKPIERRCHTIIEYLSDCNVAEKYIILKRLTESFLDVCKSEGISIKEFHFEKRSVKK